MGLINMLSHKNDRFLATAHPYLEYTEFGK